MAFFETRLPVDVSLGFSGGPQRRTEIIQLSNGREERNQRWAASRRRYDAAYGARTLDQLHAILNFFEMAAGRTHGFRVRDWTDWKSCAPQQTPSATDQPFGLGDGATTAFQLVKTYGQPGFRTWARPIGKPVAGTVLVAVNGAPQGAGWSVDPTSGAVTFAAPPAPGAALAAGFEFDVPVRFDADALEIDLAKFDDASGDAVGAIGGIPLVEDLNAMADLTLNLADLTAALTAAINQTTASAGNVEAITPSDGADLPGGLARGVYVGFAGVLVAHDAQGDVFTLESGGSQYHPVKVRRVLATGTTATGLLALY